MSQILKKKQPKENKKNKKYLFRIIIILLLLLLLLCIFLYLRNSGDKPTHVITPIPPKAMPEPYKEVDDAPKTVIKPAKEPVKKTPKSGDRLNFITEYMYKLPTSDYPYRIITEKVAGYEEKVSHEKEQPPLQILQAIPEFGSVPAGSPAVLFFNSNILLPSIPGNIFLKINDKPLAGIVRVLEYSDGKSAISIVPYSHTDSAIIDEITLVVNKSLSNQYGKGMKESLEITFHYNSPSKTIFTDGSFNDITATLDTAGDVAITRGHPDIMPAINGENFLAMTNADKLVSDNYSIASKCSYYQYNYDKLSHLSFFYNFISSEFNEYATDPFGDVALLFITGDKYQKSYIVSSVYSTGFENKQIGYRKFLNLPDRGTPYVGMTGWKKFEEENIYVKGAVTITFIITDIEYPGFHSVLLLDDIVPKPKHTPTL